MGDKILPRIEYCGNGLYVLTDIYGKTTALYEVVKCKDCKHFKFGNGCILQSIDYDWEEQMGAEDFCSRGEKRDE